MTGDTQDPAKLEAIRQLLDIYHYLAKEGVVGRWVKVFHPSVTGDSPRMVSRTAEQRQPARYHHSLA